MLKRSLAIAGIWIAVWSASDPTFALDADRIPNLVEKVRGSVVHVVGTVGKMETRTPEIPKGSPFEEFFKDFYDRTKSKPTKRLSLGSGFIVDSDGLIVTAAHVVKNFDEVGVILEDGTELRATIRGRDSKTDIALLKVETEKPLKPVRMGDSTILRLGQLILVISDPFGLGTSVTVGAVSAKSREKSSRVYDQFLQIDAAMTKGSAGGAVFNLDGEVVGLATAVISPTASSIGVGFAIPASTAAPVLAQLRKYGETRRGWLGTRIQTLTQEFAAEAGLENSDGVLVAGINASGPAKKAGLIVGDIILEFDGTKIRKLHEFPRMVAGTEIGKSVELKVWRNKKPLTLKAKIERLKDWGRPAAAKTASQPHPTSNLHRTGARQFAGMTIVPLGPKVRQQFEISKQVDKGVVVTAVEPGSSAAAKNIKAGDIVIEFDHKVSTSPDSITEQAAAMVAGGKRKALLLLSNAKEELRFVVLHLKERLRTVPPNSDEKPADQGSDPEAIFWNLVKRSNKASDIDSYLRAYPDGRFAPLARLRLKRLRR